MDIENPKVKALNPKTGRLVSINGKVFKKLIKSGHVFYDIRVNRWFSSKLTRRKNPAEYANTIKRHLRPRRPVSKSNKSNRLSQLPNNVVSTIQRGLNQKSGRMLGATTKTLRNTTGEQGLTATQISALETVRRAHKLNFEADIPGVMKKMSPGSVCRADFLHSVNKIMNHLYRGLMFNFIKNYISTQRNSPSDNKVVTIRNKDINSAINIIVGKSNLQKELRRHAHHHKTKAFTEWSTSNETPNTKNKLSKLFQTNRIRLLMSKEANVISPKFDFAEYVPHVVAGVLMYFCQELCDVSGTAARGRNSNTVTRFDLRAAVVNDRELTKLLKGYDW